MTENGVNSELTPQPAWVKPLLRLAGVYNLLWGAWVVLFPSVSLRICGYPQTPVYPQLWQCIGMIVGVYGIGYWIAARDAYRHWPIVFVGLLGKIFGPIGLLQNVMAGDLPLSAGRIIIFNDLIWWVPVHRNFVAGVSKSSDRENDNGGTVIIRECAPNFP